MDKNVMRKYFVNSDCLSLYSDVCTAEVVLKLSIDNGEAFDVRID